MGNINSAHFDENPDDIWWSKNETNCENKNAKSSTSQYPVSSKSDAIESTSRGSPDEKKDIVNDFKLELARKHEKRKEIISEKRKEMEDLRQEVLRLKKENEDLKKLRLADKQLETEAGQSEENKRLQEEIDDLKNHLEEKSRLLQDSECIIEKNRELKMSIAGLQADLQNLNTKFVTFEQERQEYRNHVVALKDVISVSKHMLQIKETELKELKQKLEDIEKSVAERELDFLSQDIKSEYERQIANIRNLRLLYEERQRVERREKQELISQLDDAKKDIQAEKDKQSELEQRISEMENDNSKKYDEIKTLESNLGLSKAESKQLQAELAVINQLFSEILLGFNSSQDLDLDKLQKHLEDHRNLLQEIVVNEISSEVSYALPKVLLDLLKQVNNTGEAEEQPKDDPSSDGGQLETIQEESESATSTIHQQMNSAEEIMENLPKVWRVLIELLSHRIVPTNTLTDGKEEQNPCYKTVETPKGPSVVLSVSQTFIRLKDLILEKKSLEKETNHLKQLNGHLENRLQDQEKRLELVHTELSKTWLVVGKMQKQHQMLHTQEKILRYELAQKRKLLTELKEELEYSREKWAEARAKNSKTEIQWRQLRSEFAARKKTVSTDDLNNSTESGYSDDRECSSSDDEPGYETDISECTQNIPTEPENEITHQEPIENEMEEASEKEDIPGAGCSKYDSNSEHLTKDIVQNTKEDNEPPYDTSEKVDDIARISSQDDDKPHIQKENKIHHPSTVQDASVTTDRKIENSPSTSTTDNIQMETIEEVLAKKGAKDIPGEGYSKYDSNLDQVNKDIVKITKETTEPPSDTPERLDDVDRISSQDDEKPHTQNEDKIHQLSASQDASVTSDRKIENSPSTCTDIKHMEILEEVLARRDDKVIPGAGCSKYDSNLEQLKEDIVKNTMENTEPPSDNSERVDDDEKPHIQNEDKIHQPSTSQDASVSTDRNIENSNSSTDNKQTDTLEEVLARRDARLKRLESQTEKLVTKVTNTSKRSVLISNKLDDLHEVYGQNSETAIDSITECGSLMTQSTSVDSLISTTSVDDISRENQNTNDNNSNPE